MIVDTRETQPEGYYSVAIQATERRGNCTLCITSWVGVILSNKTIPIDTDMGTLHEKDF
jgi:hypothetical protein